MNVLKNKNMECFYKKENFITKFSIPCFKNLTGS